MVNSLSFIGIIRQLFCFFFTDTLQYGYDVNTTVLNYFFTVSAQSKTQCYKASGYLSIDLFMRKKNEIRKHTTRTKKKKLATPGIEFVQIKKEKALDFVHLQVRRPC